MKRGQENKLLKVEDKELRCGVTGEGSYPDDMPRFSLKFSSHGVHEKLFEQCGAG